MVMNKKKTSEKKEDITILIVCALANEAKPIISHLDMQHHKTEYSFKLYMSNHIGLLISGVGKANIAAALMWSQLYCQPVKFINVGVVGCGELPLGQTLLINKIIDDASSATHYPSIHFPWKGQSAVLKTIDKPSDEYHKKQAYDMEASAFFVIANRLVTTENIFCLKVVSDNAENSYQKLSKDRLIQIMRSLLNDLDLLLDKIKYINDEFVDLDPVIKLMQQQWHITVNVEQQLREKLFAVAVLKENTQVNPPDWNSYSHAKAYLRDCEQWLQKTNPKLI